MGFMSERTSSTPAAQPSHSLLSHQPAPDAHCLAAFAVNCAVELAFAEKHEAALTVLKWEGTNLANLVSIGTL